VTLGRWIGSQHRCEADFGGDPQRRSCVPPNRSLHLRAASDKILQKNLCPIQDELDCRENRSVGGIDVGSIVVSHRGGLRGREGSPDRRHVAGLAAPSQARKLGLERCGEGGIVYRSGQQQDEGIVQQLDERRKIDGRLVIRTCRIIVAAGEDRGEQGNKDE
jgi:hypothetical protein